MIDKKNHRPAFALLPAAVAAALCAFGAPAQAACTDSGAAGGSSRRQQPHRSTHERAIGR